MRKLALLLFGLSISCTTDNIQHDSGVPDLGSTQDLGSADAGSSDTGPTDTGAQDMGLADTGAQDMGENNGCSLNITHTVIDFGVVARGTSAVRSLLLNNIGFGDCVVNEVLLVGPDFAVLMGGAAVLVPGDTLTLELQHSPATEGEARGELILRSNDAQNPEYRVELRGWGALEDVASTQTITINVQNTTASTVYVVSQGFSCAAYDVGASLGIGWQCGCECPAPSPPSATELRRLDPGQIYTFTWDGRVADFLVRRFDCTDGGASSFEIDDYHSKAVPVSPGPRTIQVPYNLAVPAGCLPEQNGVVTCDMMVGNGESPPTIMEMCPSEQVASANINLMSGDQTVDVLITP